MTMPSILRKPRVLLGAIAVFLVGMVCAWFVATEIVYQVRVRDIAPRIARPPEEVLPPRIRQVAWVAIGESGEIRMRPAHLGWFPVALFGSMRDPGWETSGFRIASRATRRVYQGDTLLSWHSLRRQENMLMATIWVTRHWTADQILSATVWKSWYGCGIYDLDTASRLFLGKPADSLDLPQVVALLAYWQSPEYYRKDSTRHQKRFEFLQEHVIENFPELAPQRGPMPRFLRSACPARSDRL